MLTRETGLSARGEHWTSVPFPVFSEQNRGTDALVHVDVLRRAGVGGLDVGDGGSTGDVQGPEKATPNTE